MLIAAFPFVLLPGCPDTACNAELFSRQTGLIWNASRRRQVIAQTGSQHNGDVHTNPLATVSSWIMSRKRLLRSLVQCCLCR
jgi:hypothetical protein